MKFQGERLVGIKTCGLLDEPLRKVCEDFPVTGFVGVGERAARGGLADAGMVEFGAERLQAGFDVAETFAPSELGERQDEKMFVSGKFASAEVAAITGDAKIKLVFGQEVQKLGEDGAALVHRVKDRKIRETSFQEPSGN